MSDYDYDGAIDRLGDSLNGEDPVDAAISGLQRSERAETGRRLTFPVESPQRAGEAFGIGKRTGVPADIIARDLEGWRARDAEISLPIEEIEANAALSAFARRPGGAEMIRSNPQGALELAARFAELRAERGELMSELAELEERMGRAGGPWGTQRRGMSVRQAGLEARLRDVLREEQGVEFPTLAETIARGWERGKNRLRTRGMIEPILWGEATPEEVEEYRAAKRDVPPMLPAREAGFFPQKAIGTAVEQVPAGARQMGVAGVAGGTGALASGGTALVLGNIGPQALAPDEAFTVPAAMATGFTVAAAAASYIEGFWMSADEALGEFLEVETEPGVEPLTFDEMRMATVAVAGINAGAELLPMAVMARSIPGVRVLVSGNAARITRELQRNPSLKRFVRRFATDLLKGGLAESGEEAFQNAVITAATNAQTEGRIDLEPGDFAFSRAQLGDIWEGSKYAFIPGAGFQAPFSAGAMAFDAHRAKTNERRVRRLHEAVEKLALGELSQDGEEDLLGELSRLEGLENVSVPAEKLMELYQSANPDVPEAELVEMLVEDMGGGEGARAQVAEVARLAQAGVSADVVVPTQMYLSRMVRRLGDGVVPHVRVRPGDYTAAEADGLEDLADAELEATAEGDAWELSLRDASELYYDSLMRNLRDAGGAPDIARVQAAFLTTRFQTRMQRLRQGGADVDPMQVFREENLRIEGPGTARQEQPAPPLARTLAAARMGTVLDAMREGTEPELENLSARPILMYLRDRGGVDPDSPLAGELRNMGVPASGAGSLPGLYRKGGMEDLSSLDVAGEPLFEGLMGQMENDRLDEATFLEAIDNELRGTRLLSTDQAESVAAARAEREDVQGILDELGIDLATATNEEVLARIAESRGDEFFQTAQEKLGEQAVAGLEALRSEFGERGVRTFVTPGLQPGDVVLHDLVVPPGDRKRGVGTEFMERLVEWADEHGFRLLLTPAQRDADTGTTSRSRLVKFYKRFGFKENKGRSRDFTINADQMHRDPKGERRELFQDAKNKKGPRGAIQFAPRSKGRLSDVVIRLGEAHDLSTLLHEAGHLYLEELLVDSRRPDAPQQITDDVNAVLNYLGVVDPEDITAEHHERFARSFEAYLREGRAPSAELEGAFRRFASWLLRIYRTLKGLDVEMSDEIRGVFDRLLATDDAIAAHTSAREVRPLWETIKDAPVTAAESAEMQAAWDRWVAVTQQQLTAEQFKALEKERGEEWARQEDEVREEVAAEVNARPVFRAQEWLRNGVWMGDEDASGLEHRKLDRGALVELFGKEVLNALPGRGRNLLWQKKGGLHPDEAASLFGFKNAHELVSALQAAGPRKSVIETETKALMRERYGDLATSGEIEARVLERMASDERLTVILAEERTLSRRTGTSPTPRQVARQVAREAIARRAIRDIRPDRDRAAAERESRAALAAAASGDLEAAQTHKRRQALHMMLEIEGRKAKERADRHVAYLRRFEQKKVQAVLGLAGQQYQDTVNAMLDRYLFRGPLPKPYTSTQILEFIADHPGEGVIISDFLRRDGERKHWREITPDELSGLRDSVANVEHLARTKLGLVQGRSRRMYSSIEGRIKLEADDALPTRRAAPLNKSETQENLGRARQLNASLRKVEFVIDLLSGHRPDSALRQYLWEPLKAGLEAREDRLAEYTEKLAGLFEALGASRRQYSKRLAEDRLAGVEGDLNRWNLIMVALNMGNESNKTKMLEGYGWNEDTAMAVLRDHLEPQDWKFVQEVWDLVGSFWPEIEAMERRLTGLAPPKIEATPLESPVGTLTGGYFPVVYDPERTDFGIRNEDMGFLPNEASGFQRAITGHGHTESRSKAVGPVLLQLSVISNHMDQVILDLSMREALINAARILQRPGVDNLIKSKLGAEFGYKNYWLPWLRHVAGDTIETGPLSFWQKSARSLRVGASVFYLGFNDVTLATQALGHANAVRELKKLLPGKHKRYWMRGLGLTAGRPTQLLETTRDVRERSSYMRNRMKNINRDVRDAVRVAQTRHGMSADAARFAMGLVGRSQFYTVDLPVWLAAYHGGIDLHGMTEERAVLFADSAVSRSQGGGTVLEQSAIERGGVGGSEFIKASQLFYSYQNLVYNQIADEIGAVRSVKDVPAMLMGLTMYLVLPGLLYQLTRGLLRDELPDPDEDDYEKKLVTMLVEASVGEAAGTIPYLRDAYPAVIGALTQGTMEYDTRTRDSSALTMAVQRLQSLQRSDRDESGRELAFDAARMLAMLKGLPANRLIRALEEFTEEE